MAQRPKDYGMTAELADKKAGKYDPVAEQEAREWIEAVVGEPIQDNFQEGLKDGIILCKLANKLQPGSVRRINESKMAFKQMQNIGNFLTFAEAYGCNKADMFQTMDLFEGQNMPQVVNAIHALGRKAREKGFDGPTPGATESRHRDFTEEQLKEGQNISGLQIVSNKGASAAGQTPYGLGRQVEKTNLKIKQ
ncbi:calponin-1-like isoform X1 [Patiria miniata]|uniref:Calponin-homology (CH) domain-containing protein n=1 Tax=Patiria miniata TaxID=46514 RepID=A0A914AWU5_PATMI|nr:calponin-1-like isoform X1 [Patiria miniata]